MSKRNKIKTYEFMYEAEGDDFECVQFCASTRKEARKLFFEYLKDEKLVQRRRRFLLRRRLCKEGIIMKYFKEKDFKDLLFLNKSLVESILRLRKNSRHDSDVGSRMYRLILDAAISQKVQAFKTVPVSDMAKNEMAEVFLMFDYLYEKLKGRVVTR